MVNVPEVNEFYLGELFYFFEFACGVSGYLLGVNPFNQPGVESYKKNMYVIPLKIRLWKKPSRRRWNKLTECAMPQLWKPAVSHRNLLGVNPFNQPGVESYKKNMFALLGKPGYEAQREELLKRL